MATPDMRAGAELDPQQLMQMHFAFAPSYILSAGIELGVFSHIANGCGTAAEVAVAARATQRGTRMLLDALASLGLLAKTDSHYALTPLAAQYLVRGQPDYAGTFLEQGGLFEPWRHLADAIRAGLPPLAVEQQKAAQEFFPALVRSLHVVHGPQAKRLAQALAAGSAQGGPEVLDVACGSGVWSLAIAEADPRARVTAQDFPGMLDLTREYAGRYGFADRYQYLAGDLNEVDFGTGRFDLALLGHIVHSEGEESSRKLFRRIHNALKPGGRAAILDMIPNDERNGPPFPLIFALNMLVHTTAGDTYTLAEYTRWLKAAGFIRVETADIGTHSPVIIATRE